MTRTEFLILCLKYNIDPALALENENIVKALRAKNNAEVERILENEF
jgi:hypothetical protein